MTSLSLRLPRVLSFFSLTILCTFVSTPCARATISYEVSLAQPGQHLFHVTMNIPDVQGELLLQMPAWNALYEIRDFSSRIQRLEGTADSQPLSVEKIDKQTWRIFAKNQITVHYAVYWDTAGPFASNSTKSTLSSILRWC